VRIAPDARRLARTSQRCEADEHAGLQAGERPRLPLPALAVVRYGSGDGRGDQYPADKAGSLILRIGLKSRRVRRQGEEAMSGYEYLCETCKLDNVFRQSGPICPT
jgi:hypothetical protein